MPPAPRTQHIYRRRYCRHNSRVDGRPTHTHKSAVLFKQPPTHTERKRRETNRVAAAQPTDRKEMRWDSRETFIEWESREILFFSCCLFHRYNTHSTGENQIHIKRWKTTTWKILSVSMCVSRLFRCLVPSLHTYKFPSSPSCVYFYYSTLCLCNGEM
jgi:hypothetical protein